MFSSDVTARGLDYPDVTLVLQVRVRTDWPTDCYDVHVCVCVSACVYVCVCVYLCLWCVRGGEKERQRVNQTSKWRDIIRTPLSSPLSYLHPLPQPLPVCVCVRLRWVWQRRTSTYTDWAVRQGRARRAAGYCSALHLKHQVWCLALRLRIFLPLTHFPPFNNVVPSPLHTLNYCPLSITLHWF